MCSSKVSYLPQNIDPQMRDGLVESMIIATQLDNRRVEEGDGDGEQITN